MRLLGLSLLFLSFLFYNATAIRLEQGFMQVGHQSIQEEKISINKINGVFGEIIVCKEGNCKGINRKLTTVISSTSTISTTSSKIKENENGGNKSKAIGEEHEKLIIISSENEEVNDHVDIMDYSPAKRKPPIHN